MKNRHRSSIDIDRLLDRLREPVLAREMSKRELSRRAGISVAALFRMETPDWNPRVDTIRALQYGLGMVGGQRKEPPPGDSPG